MEKPLDTSHATAYSSIRMSKGGLGDRGSLLRGTLDLLVLRLLAAGPKHGYAISKRLSELSDEWLLVDEGSLYPCLYRMEERGWIRSELQVSENNRRARYYTLTPSGEEELQLQSDNWRQFSNLVASVLKKG
jgi:transcriptional regulator